ncbi:leucyl/phenylalanyl-tRNA--protein transferase [Thiomicrorhabdus sp.]|uniref:leucyl/phenylalanyl-tRNA--protein transferase n=1 Tax=Thiomicrorhabdus sp. TaxID=2039724 RepID=UPI0029C77071|nr:leucyl/phenylalanyl-tRNA--protein transferase [Thiomicrorhabdus sp.]
MQNQLGPFWVDENQPPAFPPPELAATDPNGLLAVGGLLTPEWLLTAYRNGIFPWFNPDEPVLWWSPTPRSLLHIPELKISKSLRKQISSMQNQGRLDVTLDRQFSTVMHHCASVPRLGQDGSWIGKRMHDAYCKLHSIGYAHSVEVCFDGELAGGLYGVSIGKMFFGESMFSLQSNASKIALGALCMQLDSWGFEWVDTQVETPHLNSLGATCVDREHFEIILDDYCEQAFEPHLWQFDIDWVETLKHFSQRSATQML